MSPHPLALATQVEVVLGHSEHPYLTANRSKPVLASSSGAGLRILLAGLPECVQRAADAFEQAFPGQVDWRDEAQSSQGGEIVLQGVGQLGTTHIR